MNQENKSPIPVIVMGVVLLATNVFSLLISLLIVFSGNRTGGETGWWVLSVLLIIAAFGIRKMRRWALYLLVLILLLFFIIIASLISGGVIPGLLVFGLRMSSLIAYPSIFNPLYAVMLAPYFSGVVIFAVLTYLVLINKKFS